MYRRLEEVDVVLGNCTQEELDAQEWFEPPLAVGTEVTVTGQIEEGDGLSGTGNITCFEYLEGLGNCYCVLIDGVTYRVKPSLVSI